MKQFTASRCLLQYWLIQPMKVIINISFMVHKLQKQMVQAMG